MTVCFEMGLGVGVGDVRGYDDGGSEMGTGLGLADVMGGCNDGVFVFLLFKLGG